ncbi:MAG TPA: STAS domain-containing protein [Pseudonocardiaceae bacterium]
MARPEFPLTEPGAAADLLVVAQSDLGPEHPNAVTLDPIGELDQVSAGLLWAPLAEHLGVPERHVVLDLSGIEFFASVGVKILVMAAGWARAHGSTLAIVVTTRIVRQPIHLLGVIDHLPVYSRRADALAASTG